MEPHRDRLAELKSMDGGKPEHVADVAGVGFTTVCFRYYAGWAGKVESCKL